MLLEYRNIHLTKYALTIFFEDILSLSRLSITEETIKIEFSLKKTTILLQTITFYIFYI